VNFPLFLISSSLIYLQITLIRALSTVYYGALTYFIISLALLGFGAGGTFLAIVNKKIFHSENSPQFYSAGQKIPIFPLLSEFKANSVDLYILLYFLSIPIALFFSRVIPLNLLYIFYNPQQLFLVILFSILLFIPFFLGGIIIGLVLIHGKCKEFIYGINLLGSGAGGIIALFAMYFADPVLLPFFSLIPVGLALIYITQKKRSVKTMVETLSIVTITVLFIFFFPETGPDQYKDIYHYHLLQQQNDAELISEKSSPYGQIEVWNSKTSHSTLFAGLGNDKIPPLQYTLFKDGNYLSPFFLIQSPEEAEVLDETIQSLPYRILDNGRILIVGDSGLSGLWLALRYRPASVTILLPDNAILDFLLDDLSSWTEQFQTFNNVRILAEDYRQFLLLNDDQFDLIHFVSAESLTGSMSGFFTFQEDYSLTVEAVQAAWNSLSDRGWIAVTRGNQLPLKDNLKIHLTHYSSVEELLLPNPENYLFQLRNYLATINLLSKKEIDQKILHKIIRESKELNLNVTHYPGDNVNYKQLVEDWVYDVRPSRDGRPYFNSFFRWRSLGDFYNLYGQYWFRRSDLGYLILLFSLLVIILLATLFIIAPHFFRKVSIKNPFLLYFLLIGFSFMFIEMVLIQKMTLFLGHSSISISLVLCTLLISSGTGSILITKIRIPLKGKLLLAVSVIAFINFSLIFFSRQIVYINSFLFDLSPFLSWFFLLLICGFCGFFMGWFFAPALSFLEKTDKQALPVAWALNGFASVAASPLAVLLSISFGFIFPLVSAIVLYLTAVLLLSKYHD